MTQKTQPINRVEKLKEFGGKKIFKRADMLNFLEYLADTMHNSSTLDKVPDQYYWMLVHNSSNLRQIKQEFAQALIENELLRVKLNERNKSG